MTDSQRRTALSARARELRTRAEETMARCKDSGAKSLVRQMVIHRVDDVEGFFLATAVQPRNERMWLDHAEMMLSWGEQGLASLERQFAAFGSPENVQVIG